MTVLAHTIKLGDLWKPHVQIYNAKGLNTIEKIEVLVDSRKFTIRAEVNGLQKSFHGCHVLVVTFAMKWFLKNGVFHLFV
jgi:hypothetical protein